MIASQPCLPLLRYCSRPNWLVPVGLMMSLLAMMFATSGTSAAVAAAHSPVKRTRFLVLDSRIIETTENAKLTLGETVKSKHNPLMAEP